MCLRGYRRRLRIWEANYGRDCGWIIERQGRPIAVLTEPRREEMFWDSYRMEIVTDDLELRTRMFTTEFWAKAEAEGLVWRNRKFGEVAEFAFPSFAPFPEPDRLMMRRLYLPIGEPWPWDWLVLWIRRWRHRGGG
jgi:hypothetical protein